MPSPATIAPASPWTKALEAKLRRRIDGKTKPIGALGRIEALAARVDRIARSLEPRLDACRPTIFAADHGIVAEGVCAPPQAVARRILSNFLDGDAAADVFARATGASLRAVDAGAAGEPVRHPELCRAASGPARATPPGRRR